MTSKEISIHCFSGTGNSRHVSDLLAQVFTSAGSRVISSDIENHAGIKAPNASMNVFICPVYAFSVPHIMREYILNLPNISHGKAAVIAVFGNLTAQKPGNEGATLEQMRRLLEDKGYDVVLTDVAGYPANFTQFMNPPTEHHVKEIRQASDENVKKLALKILSGEKSLRKCNPVIYILASMLAFVFYNIGRRFAGKMFSSDSKCISCGLCARQCPAQAIHLVMKRPKWDWDCQACQRCINICPRKAIQASMARIIILHGLFFVPYAGLLDLKWYGGVKQTLLYAIAHLTCYGAALVTADTALFYAERIPVIGAAVSWGFTKKRRRYLAEEFKGKQ